MTAFNAVRFKVKAGGEQQFLDAHNKVAFAWPGVRHVNIIKTGEHTFCLIAEWTDMDAIVNARDRMIATLDSFRDTLEELGSGLGVTDPVSGPREFIALLWGAALAWPLTTRAQEAGLGAGWLDRIPSSR